MLHPLPRAHRLLTSPTALPHICQLVLTRHPAIVAAAARLLYVVLEHNAQALSR